jgi:hypothetical protein
MSSRERAAAEAGMRWLFAAVFERLRQMYGDKVSNEELHQAARGALQDVSLEETGPSWQDALPCTVQQTQRLRRLHKPVVVVATIAEWTAPQAVTEVMSHEGEPSAAEHDAIKVRVADATGDIWSLDILGEELVDRVQARAREGGANQVLAVPIALPINFLNPLRKEFFLHVLDLRESKSALDSLGATRDERQRVQEQLATLRRAGVAPVDYLSRQVVASLNVVGLDTFPLLGELLRFTSYQALSCGRIDHAPGRLHAIVAGPPGVGKKLLQLAAKMQNPIAMDASPVKVSAAGLVGASSQGKGRGWTSKPGLLALAAGGVLLLQDAHGWSPSVARKLAPILQEVMEDGVVRDSVAGGITREATAALLIDANRLRHLSVAGGGAAHPAGGEATILTIRPVLSRADLLCDIPDDAERAWAVGRSMVGRVGARETPDRAKLVRELQLLVALLRDRHPDIDLEPVRTDMGSAYDRIYEANRDVIRDSPDAGDIPTRLVITLARYVSAIARGHDRADARSEDVDEAVRYVDKKLAFLRMLPAARATRAQSAEDFVTDRAGETVRPSDLVDDFEAQTGTRVHERTMRRIAQRLGGQPAGKGTYLLPPPPGRGSGESDK